jgi:hypothetical protein
MNKADEGIPVLNKFMAMRDGTLIKGPDSPKIYTVECTDSYYSSCTKRHIQNYETFQYLGYKNSDTIYTIPQSEVQLLPEGAAISGQVQHPNGSLVSDQFSGKIYLIKNSIRYHIPTATIFNINRYEWKSVKNINQYDRNLPVGIGFPAYDTNLLARAADDVRVWSIGDNTYGTTYRKHISTYLTFQSLGYHESEIIIIENSILFSYPAIPPYPY